MKKCFVFLALSTLLCIVGCQRKEPNMGQYDHYYTIEIDTTLTCCGIDNPVQNMDWLHDKVQEFISDSTQRKKQFRTFMMVDVYMEKETSADVLWIYISDNDKGELMSCDGTSLFQGTYPDRPNGNPEDNTNYKYQGSLVYIEMGYIGQI